MILVVIFVVLMMFWLFFGCYSGYDPAKPHMLGNTLIPWLCVAILGWILFGGGHVPLPPR
jgi:hypothetical protein